MKRKNIVILMCLAAFSVLLAAGLALAEENFAMMRVTTASASDRASEYPSLNADGSLVAFESDSDFLGQGVPAGQVEIWLYDTTALTYTRITTASDGGRDSNDPSLSAAGTRVAFESDSDLLGQAIPDGQFEIWLYDTAALAFTRVTTSSSGTARDSYNPSLSANGSVVAFESDSDLLGQGIADNQWEIWLYDVATAAYTRVTTASDGGRDSYEPSVSADGTLVAFTSDSDFLGQGAADNATEVWLYDTLAMTYTRVTTASDPSNRDCYDAALSADGSKLFFQSDSDYLGEGIQDGQFELWMYDVAAQTLTRFTWASDSGSRDSWTPSPSADGRFVSFDSDSAWLDPSIGDGQFEVWLYDTLTMDYTRVTSASDSTRNSGYSSLSADGTRLAFRSDADFLGQGLPTGQFEIWLAQARLSLAKSVDNDSPAPGQRVTYTLAVYSPIDEVGAVVSDTLPPELNLAGPVTLEPAQPGAVLATQAGDLPILASNLTLTAGERITLTFPVTVTIATAPGTFITNTAVVTSPRALPGWGWQTSVVQDDPITGLLASNDGPTELGHATHFSATVSGGTNVSYVWDFGDGLGVGLGANPVYTFTAKGVYTATVTATNSIDQKTATTQVVVFSSYDVSLEPPADTQHGQPGQMVNYTLRLTNTGILPDVFDITCAGNVWDVSLSVTQTALLAGEGADVMVSVSVPSGALNGEHDQAAITATSQGNPARSDTAVLTTLADAVYGVAIVPPKAARSSLPGVTVSYTLRLTNTGQVADTFDLTLAGAAWSTQLSPTQTVLAASQAADVNVQVEIPTGLPEGASDTVTLTVASQTYITAVRTSRLTTTMYYGRLIGAGGGYIDTYPAFVERAIAYNTDMTVTLVVLPSSYFGYPVPAALTPQERQAAIDYFWSRLGDLQDTCDSMISAPVTCSIVLADIFIQSDAYDLDPSRVGALNASADGVYMRGGDQRSAMQVLANTPAEAALEALYMAGVPVAGSSAGAAIQSRYMNAGYQDWAWPWHGLEYDSILLWYGPMDTYTRGLRFGTDLAVIDQHFWQRGRMARLLQAAQRLPVGVPHVGLGVDYQTSAEIQNGVLVTDVYGFYGVMIQDQETYGAAANARYLGPRQLLSIRNVAVHTLPPGPYGYDLEARRPVINGATDTVAPDITGRNLDLLYTPAGAGPLLVTGDVWGDQLGLATQRFAELAQQSSQPTVVLAAGFANESDALYYAGEWAANLSGLGVANVQTAVLTDSTDLPALAAQLQAAGAIFVTGDNQAVMAQRVPALNTVNLPQLWREGRVLLLDYAAAPAAGEWMTAMIVDDYESEARESFKYNTLPISPGLSLIPNAVFEPRVMYDYLYGRLVNHVYNHTDVVAFGIERNTALELTAHSARVVGEGSVFAVDGRYARTLDYGDNDVIAATWLLLDTYSPGESLAAEYGLTLLPTAATLPGDPGQTVTHTLRLTNTGDAVTTFTLAYTGNVWAVSLPVTQIELQAKQGADVVVNVSIPSEAQANATDGVTLTVSFKDRPGLPGAAAHLTTTANAVYGVALKALTTAQSGDCSQTVTYTLALTNAGNIADTFTITYTGNAWNVRMPTLQIALQPGDGQSFVVYVDIPHAPPADSDDVTIHVTSAGDGSQTADAVLTTTANRRYKIYLPLTAKN